MAKDGTNRGGARPGTGPKKKALIDKINEGKTEGAMILPEPSSIPSTKPYRGRTLLFMKIIFLPIH